MKNAWIGYSALAVSLSLLSGEMMAAPVRNEALASRFLYCANVSQFFYQYLLKNEPNSRGINGYRESKNAFWLAAAVASDGPYITAEKDKALNKVIEVLEQEKREKTSLMEAEAKSCLETLQNDAIPMLKPEPTIKQ